MGEHSPGQHRRQPHPSIVGELPRRTIHFEQIPLNGGVGIVDAAIPQVLRDLVLAESA